MAGLSEPYVETLSKCWITVFNPEAVSKEILNIDTIGSSPICSKRIVYILQVFGWSYLLESYSDLIIAVLYSAHGDSIIFSDAYLTIGVIQNSGKIGQVLGRTNAYNFFWYTYKATTGNTVHATSDCYTKYFNIFKNIFVEPVTCVSYWWGGYGGTELEGITRLNLIIRGRFLLDSTSDASLERIYTYREGKPAIRIDSFLMYYINQLYGGWIRINKDEWL
jgi:hypothetical protein